MAPKNSADLVAEYDDVAPEASAMIESMRAHGYTLATAIADLIDNSIAAKSNRVWLQMEWAGDDSWISIVDDGVGMTEKELVNAMRLGSRSPLELRDSTDLGRFGLGLKTASFSQSRRLTVVTRPRDGGTFLRRWDLDHLADPNVHGWQLLRTKHTSTGSRSESLDQMSLAHGTQVLLEAIDRVVGPQSANERDKDREDHFLWEIERVKEHLSMVFHRFLDKNRNSLKIFLNGEPLKAWDPFLEHHAATQLIGSYSEKLRDYSEHVRVKGFVLPHRDRFNSANEHKVAGGPRGWNAQQGFYVYRGERLIIAGEWLSLRWQKEEHFKLARILVDIPNTMDHEWQIDVKKSTAAPPPVLRDWLTGIAQTVRKTAKEVYAHRGKYGPRKKRKQPHSKPWITIKKSDGEFSYRIDRKHDVLEPFIRSLNESKRKQLETLLRLVEETVPVQRIWLDIAENQNGAAQPFANERPRDLRDLIILCHTAQTDLRGLDRRAAWDVLAEFDGFQGVDAQAIIGQLKDEDS